MPNKPHLGKKASGADRAKSVQLICMFEVQLPFSKPIDLHGNLFFYQFKYATYIVGMLTTVCSNIYSYYNRCYLVDNIRITSAPQPYPIKMERICNSHNLFHYIMQSYV